MKVRRYSASGSTQRNGTLEMFWVMWLVTASSITEPITARISHWRCFFTGTPCTGSGSVLACASKPFIDNHAVPAQRSAKETNRNDQPHPRLFRSKVGSKRIGKPSKASSEARLESANSRYGTTLLNLRQYHACSSGVVVESRK